MVTRRYRCGVCLKTDDIQQPISAPLLTVCAVSSCGAPALAPVPSWQGSVVLPGGAAGRMVNGENRFRKPEIVRERDGRETVYTSLEQMKRGELERAPHPKIALDNVKRAARRLLPHTDAAKFQTAIEERVA
jgi:hypothetical protein